MKKRILSSGGCAFIAMLLSGNAALAYSQIDDLVRNFSFAFADAGLEFGLSSIGTGNGAEANIGYLQGGIDYTQTGISGAVGWWVTPNIQTGLTPATITGDGIVGKIGDENLHADVNGVYLGLTGAYLYKNFLFSGVYDVVGDVNVVGNMARIDGQGGLISSAVSDITGHTTGNITGYTLGASYAFSDDFSLGAFFLSKKLSLDLDKATAKLFADTFLEQTLIAQNADGSLLEWGLGTDISFERHYWVSVGMKWKAAEFRVNNIKDEPSIYLGYSRPNGTSKNKASQHITAY